MINDSMEMKGMLLMVCDYWKEEDVNDENYRRFTNYFLLKLMPGQPHLGIAYNRPKE